MKKQCFLICHKYISYCLEESWLTARNQLSVEKRHGTYIFLFIVIIKQSDKNTENILTIFI